MSRPILTQLVVTQLVVMPLAALTLVLGPAAVAGAQVIPFSGTRSAENIPIPMRDIGRCGGPPNALITGIFGAGMSNLGAFSTVESNCLNPITGGLFNGLFTFQFSDGSSLFGTASGTVVLPPIGGSTTNSFLYIITGGTSLFAGATGQLDVAGIVRFNPDGTTSNTFTYVGAISTVPEPATVLLLGVGLVGIGLVGAGGTVRKRRAAPDGTRGPSRA